MERTIFMNYRYGLKRTIFGFKYTAFGKANEGFVFLRHGSVPAQHFFNCIILLFCFSASLACEPDVHKNALTVHYSVYTQETVWREIRVQLLLLPCNKTV